MAVVFCGHEDCPTRVRGLALGGLSRPQDPRDSLRELGSAATPWPGKVGKKKKGAHADGGVAGSGAAAGGVLTQPGVGRTGTGMYRRAGISGHGAGRCRGQRRTGVVVCGDRTGEEAGEAEEEECQGRWWWEEGWDEKKKRTGTEARSDFAHAFGQSQNSSSCCLLLVLATVCSRRQRQRQRQAVCAAVNHQTASLVAVQRRSWGPCSKELVAVTSQGKASLGINSDKARGWQSKFGIYPQNYPRNDTRNQRSHDRDHPTWFLKWHTSSQCTPPPRFIVNLS